MEMTKEKKETMDWQSLERELTETRMALKDVILQVKALTAEVAKASKPMLNRKEAAAFMGVSTNTVNMYCSGRVLSYHRSKSGLTYFDKEDLLEFMRDTEVKADEIGRQDVVDSIRLKRLRRTEPKSMAI